MKKYNESYINTTYGDALKQFMKDDDIFKLIEKTQEVDEKDLPVVLYFAIMNNVANLYDTISHNFENKTIDFFKELKDNEKIINQLSQIQILNNTYQETQGK